MSFNSESQEAMEPAIHSEFEHDTGTWQYVVADPSTMVAAIIDPVLDYDRTTQGLTTRTADSLLALVKENGYKVDWILETHVHADHLTAASYLQNRLAQEQEHRPSVAIGKRIGQVQKFFGKRYGVPEEQYEVVFDHLFEDDERFKIGNLHATAIHLPGHTPDHMGYKIGGKTSHYF
jgi:glyoxylase-like metal-dependent hydrolase (beta-lactamase superfamily II)